MQTTSALSNKKSGVSRQDVAFKTGIGTFALKFKSDNNIMVVMMGNDCMLMELQEAINV